MLEVVRDILQSRYLRSYVAHKQLARTSLSMVLRERAPSARAELRYYINATDNNERPPFDCPGLTMLFYNTVQHLHIKFTV